MRRVTTSTAVAVQPAPRAAGAIFGFFTPGSDDGLTPATVPGAEWFNQMQEENMSLLADANIAPDNTGLVLNQVLLSIRVIIANNTDKSPAINGGCLHGQLTFGRPQANLTASPQYAGCDRWAVWASGGTPTAGTIQQEATNLVGSTGYACSALGVTGTGALALSWRMRFESRDVRKYKNIAAILADLHVYQDTGGNVNYTITLNKANALDNFSAVTQIGASGNLAVATASDVNPFFSIAPGDCSNGLEIIVTAACGALAVAKNFRCTMLQVRTGNYQKPFSSERFAHVVDECQRYYLQFGQGASGFYINSSQLASLPVTFGKTMRAVPVCSIIGGGAVNYVYAANNSVTCSTMGTSSFDQNGGNLGPSTTGAGAAATPIKIGNGSWFQADAEL